MSWVVLRMSTLRPPSGRTAKQPHASPRCPSGRASTSTTSTMPSTICQYTVWPDRVGLEVVEDERADDRAEEGLEAAQHREEDDLAREGPVQDVGGREPVERHPERARPAR